MLNPVTLDRINAFFEAFGCVPTFWGAWCIYRARSSAGSSLLSYAYWCGVGCWWIYYYTGLAQWWTVASVTAWLVAFAIQSAMVLAFKPCGEKT